MADINSSFDNHPAILGADTVNSQSGGEGMLSSDLLTKGIPAAAASGLMSIVNTGLSYAGQNQVPVEQALRNLDNGWADYYRQHQEGADLAGFIGASVSIAGLTTKALQLGTAGEAVGPVSRAFGLASSGNRTALQTAIEELGAPGGSMASKISSTTWSRLGWATADNLLTAAAAETAVLATMKESPLLDGYSTKDFLLFSALGGGIGGGAEFLAGRGILKRAAGTIEHETRRFDTLLDPTNLGLSPSDEAIHLADSMVKLAKDYTKTPFEYTYAGKTKNIAIPTEELFQQARSAATKSGFDKLALKMNTLAGDNVNVGQAFFDHMVGIIKSAESSGQPANVLTDTLAGILGSVRSISPVTSSSRLADDAADLFYVNKKSTSALDLVSAKYSRDGTYKTPYKLAPGTTAADLNVTTLDGVTNVKDAFNQGADIAIDLKGRPRINPNSSKILKGVSALDSHEAVFDLESGVIGNSHVPTAADSIGNYSKDVRLSRDGVLIGDKHFPMHDSVATSIEHTTVDVNARYIWTSKLSAKDIARMGSVDAHDLPMLTRVSELRHQLPDDFKVRLRTGEEMSLVDIKDITSFTKNQKIEFLRDAMDGHTWEDVRALAVYTNSSKKWVSQVIQNGFIGSRELDAGLLRTIDAATPKAIALKFDWSGMGQQFYRGTKADGKELTGALIKPELVAAMQADKFAKAINTKLIDDNNLGVASRGTYDMAKKSDAFAAGYSSKDIIGRTKFTSTEVYVANTPRGKQGWGGNTRDEVLAHELGHALDFFLHQYSEVRNSFLAQLSKNTAMKSEIGSVAKQFKPGRYSNGNAADQAYLRTPSELTADAFAVWMVRPELRSEMPLFAAKFGKQLSEFEQYWTTVKFTKTNGPNFLADAALMHEYRLRIATKEAQNAFSSVFGEDAKLFQPVDPELARFTSSQGAGATLLGASNASYGQRAEQFVQHTGKMVNQLELKYKNAVTEALGGVSYAIRNSPEAAAELGILTTALRRNPDKFMMVTENGVRRVVNSQVGEELKLGKSLDEAVQALQARGIQAEYKVTNQEVLDFLQSHTELNDLRNQKKTALFSATGLSRRIEPGTIYVPPVDTVRYPNVAFVRARTMVGAQTDISMITARTPDQLRALAAKVPEEYEVVFKEDVKNFYQAKGQYDYGMTVHDSRVNSELQRRGVLGDFFPETRAENVLDDYVRFHLRGEEGLIRQGVQTNYAQFFGQMRFLSEQYTKVDTSVAKGMLAIKQSKIADPFGDYIKTALNISKQNEFPLLDSLNEFVDMVGRKAYEQMDKAFIDAHAGIVPYDKANEVAARFGLGQPFDSMSTYLTANQKVPKNLVSVVTGKVNSLLSTFGLRLDFVNSLVNILSTPVMMGMELKSLQSLAKSDPATLGKLTELYSTVAPGTNQSVPSFSKLLFKAVDNYFGPDKERLVARYTANGDITSLTSLHHQLLDDIAYKPWEKISDFQKRVDGWIEKGSRVTGNNFAEEFTRFVSADAMRQLTEPLVDAGKISLQEANSYISIFTNRVQGNYVTSQRPALFQGTSGRAISLFQTYFFNVMQQLTRHIEDRSYAALLTFSGLQTSVYGLNGLPYFDAVNQQLIGRLSSNPSHKDAYSELPATNKALGEWLMFGTASAFPLFDGKGLGLYSRGDLNPRTLIGLPTSLADIPAVSGATRLVQTLTDLGKNVASGGDLSNSLLLALEHQGISRPLAGFAQVLAGRSTTNHGDLVSAANDLNTTSMLSRIQDRVVNFGSVQRILGSRPMDEAIMLTAIYKNKEYDALDKMRIEELGQAIKTKLYAGGEPSQDELTQFMTKYAAAGGRIETFNQKMVNWMRASNQSTVNRMSQKLNSPYSQRLQTLMGGEQMPDYQNQSAEQTQ